MPRCSPVGTYQEITLFGLPHLPLEFFVVIIFFILIGSD